MKKHSFLCLLLAFLLCCAGCVTLQLEPGNTVVSPDNTYTQPMQPTAPPEQPTLSVIPAESTQTNPANADKTELAWSVSEIVSFLNTAVNSTKNNNGSFSFTENVRHTVTEQQVNSESLREMALSVIDKFNFSSKKQYLAAGGLATSDNVSVLVQDLLFAQNSVFALAESEVAGAKVFSEGQNISIAMLLQEDTSNATLVPALHAEKMPYLHLHGQSVAPYSVQSANIRYTNITLAATVNAQGMIVNLTMTAKAQGEAKIGLGVMAAQVQFAAELYESREYNYY